MRTPMSRREARFPSVRWSGAIAAVAVGLAAGRAAAQDWYWHGGSSANWSDLANWNSAADGSGSTPASTAALQNKILMLWTTKPNLPSNQDIESLAVSQLRFDATVTSFTITGQPIQINGYINNTANPATTQTVTFQNHLVLNSGTAWVLQSRPFVVRVEGGMSETGGSRSYAADQNGRAEFRSPVTITGGWRNNQTVAAFYGMETLGTFPSTLNPDYFRTGWGTMQFNSPDGSPYEYELPATVGGMSTESLALNVPTDVVVVFHGPTAESAANKGINKLGGGVLYLNGNNTFTGTITLSDGMLVLGGSLSAGDGTKAIGTNNGTLDLNGHDVLGRKLTFANPSGFQSSGVLRNSNRSVEATLDGNMTTVANSGSIVQFGGPGTVLQKMTSGCWRGCAA